MMETKECHAMLGIASRFRRHRVLEHLAGDEAGGAIVLPLRLVRAR